MAGQGTTILASDFNTIQGIISNVLGTGSGTLGYGQPVTSGPVSVGDKIALSGWNALRNDLIAARQHQTGANESGNLTTPSTAILVRESDRAAYLAYAQLIQTHALDAPPTSGAPGIGAQAGTIIFANSERTTPWNTIVTHTVTLTFASANAARYYFNAGGNIQFSAILTALQADTGAGPPAQKGYDWQQLLSNMGTVTMNYNSTTVASGTALSNVGYYQLTTTPQTIVQKLTPSPSYTGNQYDLTAQINATGSVITFNAKFQDLSTGGTDELINGKLTSTCVGFYATGSNVSITQYLPAVTQSGP